MCDKPRISLTFSRTTGPRWKCVSTFSGANGLVERIGTGYSMKEAYWKWCKFGHFGGNMAKQLDRSPMLTGNAKKLWQAMCDDNGCKFRVTKDQARCLLTANSVEMTELEIETLAAGEYEDQLQIIGEKPNLRMAHHALERIFNNP